MKRKVGILGGTFDPPHLGHLIIADQVQDFLQLDEIWFMPNFIPPHKIKESNTTNMDRLSMVNRAVSGHSQFRIETIELEREGKSYTYDTIVLLKERDPEILFYFIIGGDMIDYLPNWHRIEELIEEIQFVGVKRPGYESNSNYPVMMVDLPMIDLSSSIIRNKIKNGQSVKYLLPDSVLAYIKEHDLYEPK